MLIAFEGIDGSGKGTQAKLLRERLLKPFNQEVQLLSFPRYTDTFFGQRVGDYLNGRYGTLKEVDPFLASLLFAGDRLESRPALLQLLEENEIVILDRYVHSNIAHQVAKVAAGPAADDLQKNIEYVEWTLNQMPQPDLVIFLNIDVDLAIGRIKAKPQRNYTAKAADIHEADRDYLRQVSRVYNALCTADNGRCWWQICSSYNSNPEESPSPRTPEQIAADVYAAVATFAMQKLTASRDGALT